jgi:DNA polymerase-4
MSQRIIFHLDVDAFFASAEQSLNPFLRGKPVIVGGLANQRGVVHSASYEARAFGVKTGMPLSQARKLCPHAIFLKGNFLHYRYLSRSIYRILQQYSPAVEISSLDDMYMDMTGMSRLFSHPEIAAKAIQQEIDSTLHLPVSIGIGSSKLISRLASAQNKPRGITYIPPEQELEFLHALPVSQLIGVGHVTESLLAELGIQTVGQLARIPKRTLEQLFGTNGVRLWEFAHGIDPRPVRPWKARRQISRETTFEEDTDDPGLVLATLQYLSERIAMKLRKEHLVCNRISVRIRFSDFQQRVASSRLPLPTQDASAIVTVIHRLFRSIADRRVRIRHVHLAASQLEPENWQPQFFQQSASREALLDSIDEIRRRYGFTAILPATTRMLQKKYRMEKHGYILHTPSLSQ